MRVIDSGAGFIIRPIVDSDYPETASMLRALAAETAHGSNAKAEPFALQKLGPSGKMRFDAVVAEAAGGMLAGLCLYTWSFSGWRGTAGLFVEDLYVMPEWRKSGLGRKLMAAAARREAPNGAHFLKLEVASGNLAAVRFYRSIGFETDDRERLMILEQAPMAVLARG